MKEILVVDDDDGTLEAIAELLRDAGYRTSTATTGDEALRRLRRARPDLVLMDLIMPNMDGWELLARLREDSELARVPKVVMTAWPRPDDLPEGVSVLSKPFEWDTLLHVVRDHCGSSSTSPNSGTIAKCLPSPEPELGVVCLAR
jgi:CheY-like chemotaxis protein